MAIPSCSIILADDHELVRAGIRSILETFPSVRVEGEAGDGKEALELVRRIEPDVLLLDITLPGLNGLEVAERIQKLGLGTRVLMLSMHAGPEYVARAIQSGAVGYLVKDSTPDMLLGALNTIVQGHYYFDPTILDEVVNFLREQHIPGPTTSDDRYDKLTPREQEVMRLVAQGLSSKEIAAKLYISPKTVENHRTKIMEKLQLASVVDLVKYAAQLGVIDVRSWKGNPE